MLYAEQIDHGRSEIWLGRDGKELTSRRRLATNEVVNVTRRLCPQDVFEKFYGGYYRTVGQVASLHAPNLAEIAAELKLSIP